MTITECADKQGYSITGDFDEVPDYCWAEVLVGFYDDAGMPDQTSFDIENPLLDSGLQDLVSLFNGFCDENDFPTDTVMYLEIPCVASTYEELVRLTP